MAKKTFTQQKDRKRLIPRIVESYKKSTMLEKVGGFLSLLILLTALFFNIGENPLMIVLFVTGIFAVANILIYKASLVFSGLILAVHIASIPFLSSLYAWLSPNKEEVDLFSPFAVLSFATFAFAIIAYRVCRGRYWLSLGLTLLALGLGGLLIALTLNIHWGTWPGIILASLAVIVRAVPWRATFRKNDNFISPNLANSSQDGLTTKLFTKLKYETSSLSNQWPLSHIAYSKKRIFLVSTFTPSKALIINKNRFYYDGAFIEPMIFEIAKTADEWCRANKVDSKYVTTVAIIHNKVYYPSSDSLLSIKIAEKGLNHTEKQLHLITPDGMEELLEQEVPHLPYKTYQKLEKEYPHA
jgi:hypothetical protein